MNTAAKIDVMVAYLNGEDIEWSTANYGVWTDCQTPNWNWADFAFRIKVEAKEMTVDEIEQELGYKIKVVK